MRWMPQPFRTAPVDIIQEPNGTVWVTTDTPKYWGNYFERAGEFGAQSHRGRRGTHDYSRRRSGPTSGRASNGHPGSGSYFDESSHGTRDPLFVSTKVHELMEEYYATRQERRDGPDDTFGLIADGVADNTATFQRIIDDQRK